MAPVKYSTFLAASCVAFLSLLSPALIKGEDEIKNKIPDYPVTQEQKQQLDQLRELNKDLLTLPYMKTDKYLMSWIEGKPSDFNKAQLKLRKFLKYRAQNKLDTILEEDWTAWRKNYPFTVYGADKEGCQVAGWRIGTWNLRKALLTQPEKMHRYVDFILEYLYVAQVFPSPCKNGTVLGNLDGFSLQQQGCLPCVSFILHVANLFDQHYPTILKKLYFVNVPRIFHPILTVLRRVISENTAKALEVYGYDRSDWEPVILSGIPAQILPPEYGGTRKRN